MSTIFIKLLITPKRKSPYPPGKGLEAKRLLLLSAAVLLVDARMLPLSRSNLSVAPTGDRGLLVWKAAATVLSQGKTGLSTASKWGRDQSPPAFILGKEDRKRLNELIIQMEQLWQEHQTS